MFALSTAGRRKKGLSGFRGLQRMCRRSPQRFDVGLVILITMVNTFCRVMMG
jgi:hypothetical protein